MEAGTALRNKPNNKLFREHLVDVSSALMCHQSSQCCLALMAYLTQQLQVSHQSAACRQTLNRRRNQSTITSTCLCMCQCVIEVQYYLFTFNYTRHRCEVTRLKAFLLGPASCNSRTLQEISLCYIVLCDTFTETLMCYTCLKHPQ